MREPTVGNIRKPVWQGVQEVSALWFPAAWLSLQERESRMIAAWLPGCRAWRFALGDVLVLPQPRIAACASLTGQALCRVMGALYSGPVTEREVADMPAADIGLVMGAQLVALRFDQAQVIDLSAQIDLEDYALHDTYDCRIAVATRMPELDGKSVRTLLGDAVPPASKASEDFLARVLGKPGSSADARSSARASPNLIAGLVAASYSVFSHSFSWLASIVGLHKDAQRTSGTIAARHTAPAPQGWRALLTRLALITRVSKMIGFRQGAYLRRMMRKFEEGDLDEALRVALPLDGLGAALGQAFSAPGRRNNLNLSSGNGGALGIGLAVDLQAHLRTLYRRAFESYDRQGRTDEAVFVLAELLGARQEALDYLSKHGRDSQAAELALGWDMPAATIIRFLMLAGDSQRAVQVARRDGAFSAAIQMLESKHPALADQLRLDWGDALIAQGDWLAAVNAVWPLPQARQRAIEWLLAAERVGGELGGRALVQRAALLPDTIERYAPTIDALSDPHANADVRTEMARALMEVSTKGPAVRALATHLLPAVAADRTAARNAFTRKELDSLMSLSGDPYLKADMPGWDLTQLVETTPLWKLTAPIECAPPSPGLHAIHDALVLPGQRYLVALGEAGVAILDGNGKIRQRYAVPAYRLVGSDLGRVALAVAQRERVTRVSRLDLVTHSIADRGVLPLAFFARSFNGIGWTVVIEQRILVLDTQTPACDPLWHVGDLGGQIHAAGFFADREVFLVKGSSGWRDWVYETPSRRLLSRQDLQIDEALPLLPHPAAVALQPAVQQVDDHAELRYRADRTDRRCILCIWPEGPEPASSFIALDRGIIAALHSGNHIDYFVVSTTAHRVVAQVRWPRATPAQVHEHLGQILFHDSEGRLLHIDANAATSRPLSCH